MVRMLLEMGSGAVTMLRLPIRKEMCSYFLFPRNLQFSNTSRLKCLLTIF